MADRVVVTRAEARRRGEIRYFTGRPCLRGHVAERCVTGKKCLECHRVAERVRYAASPPTRDEQRDRYAAHRKQQCARKRAWRVEQPDHAAAKGGLDYAMRRAPGCVPDDFDLRSTIPFYAEARRRTRDTGIAHDVDHILALVLGGQHVATNLQVLPRRENRQKATAERAMAKARLW